MSPVRRRRRRLPDSLILIPAGAALAWFAYMFIFPYRRPSAVPAHARSAFAGLPPWKQTPRKLLVTATPRCSQRHGQYFLTKMLQSKLALARSLRWPVWVLGGGELSASTPLMGAQADDASPDIHPSSQWPGILQQMVASQMAREEAADDARWLVWMDAELLLVRPDSFAWVDADVDVVLLSSDVVGTADEAFPQLELSLAFVRVCPTSVAILGAWSAAITASAARTSHAVYCAPSPSPPPSPSTHPNPRPHPHQVRASPSLAS